MNTAGGYRCMQCMNDLMINTTDGTCSCPAGRYAKDVLDCADCNKGSYCPGGKYEGPGVPAQVPCGTGLTTEGQRSTSIYLCVNAPGTYYQLGDEEDAVPSAVVCPVNTYGPGLKKQRACVPCSPGTTTSGRTGRTTLKACGVPDGYYLKGPGLVAPCPQGEYKIGSGALAACTKCHQGVTTPGEASPSPDFCNVLLPGYSPLNITEGEITETQPCPQSYYCPGGSPNAAFDPAEPAETYGTMVVPCPNGTFTQAPGASADDQCMTPPGHQTVDGETTECPDDAYRAQWVPASAGAVCEHCGNGISASPTDFITIYPLTPGENVTQLPVKVSAASCYIRPGQGVYFSSASGEFTAVDCKTGQYGIPNVTYGLMAFPCRSCPDGMTTSKYVPESAQYYVSYGNGRGGFTDANACIPRAGYGYNGRMATRCPAGWYNPSGSMSPCTQCPYGRSTPDEPEAQVSVDNCWLAPGFGFHNNQTSLCPIGTYNDDLQSSLTTPCKACPTGLSTTQQGGLSVDDCNTCAPGYGGANCSTQCGAGNGPNFGTVGRAVGRSCVSCPPQTVGFGFDYLGRVQLFQPVVVARAGADSPADCLNEFNQIEDSAFHMGGSVLLTAVPAATTFEACVANCKADNNCQYITFDYEASAFACQKKTAGYGRDLLAFKSIVAGDTTAASLRFTTSKALSSGTYTFYRDDASGIGASFADGSTASVDACLASCDALSRCAAVVMTDVTGFDSVPSRCTLVMGDGRVGVFKRSMTKTVVSRLTVPPMLPQPG